MSTTSTTGTTTYAPSEGTPAPSSAPGAGATTAPLSADAAPGASTPVPGGPLGRGARTSTSARGGGTHVSALAIVLAALGAALALACAGWALARRRALEPHWWLSLRHSVAEAEYRASCTWAEFTDWARLGH